MNDLNEGPGYDPKNLQIIFFALLFMQIIFFFISVYVLEGADFHYNLNDISFTAIPLATLVLDLIANKYFINGFNKLTGDRDMNSALQKLNSIHIVRWALVEAGTLLLICFTIITANHFFSAFAILNIVYFTTLRPKIFTFNEGF